MALALWVMGAGVFYAIWGGWIERRRKAILRSKNSSYSLTIVDVRERLKAINETSTCYLFTAESRVNIVFRGMALTIVFGKVGAPVPSSRGPSWGIGASLLALAAVEQVFLLEAYPKVFRLASAGAQDSVYFVNLGKLLRVLESSTGAP